MNCDKESDNDRLSLLRITPEGIISFLASSYIEGIGKTFASRIVDRFGTGTLDVIDSDPEALSEITGMGQAKIASLTHSVSALKYPMRLLAFLFSCGLSDTHVEKILSHYGKLAADVVLYDPYEMVEDVWKLSFFVADRIGKGLGIAHDDPRRLRGALLTAVKIYAQEGSMFATREQAIQTASRITGVGAEKIVEEIPQLLDDGRLIDSYGGLYLPVYYKAEKEGASKIANIIKAFHHPDEMPLIPTTDRDGKPYTSEQLRAIETAATHPVMILTGGPGTGKTTAIRGIIDMLESQGKEVLLAAPTGRAAKRMSDLSGREAKTIHRILGHRPGEGYRKKTIDADVLIIDEGSMLEQVLFNHLLQALPSDIRIIIVGDVDQLPAIGAGDVLRDMISSGTVPVITLNDNFRHAPGSAIAATARAINAGLLPEASEGSDFSIIREPSPGKIHDRILSLVTHEIPSRQHIDPKDILVVTPQQDGPLGARQLNLDLQQYLNPSGPALTRGTKTLRLGDRVMQTSNSYDRQLYNGETGCVTAVDIDKQTLEVTFADGNLSTYRRSDLGELSLAYATTVHKLQGSEVEYMVMPLTSSHRTMLYRNLLYTGVSRARSLCVLVGDDQAIRTAIDNSAPSRRNSNFRHRLRHDIPPFAH
ncbi:MAG: ATP-dependent RecD-like DNA helicase [Muribaculaceae bacterium]|nr:ATP-dependent RecD-like DNA helicase [Muribaculaceae bacterium]